MTCVVIGWNSIADLNVNSLQQMNWQQYKEVELRIGTQSWYKLSNDEFEWKLMKQVVFLNFSINGR